MDVLFLVVVVGWTALMLTWLRPSWWRRMARAGARLLVRCGVLPSDGDDASPGPGGPYILFSSAFLRRRLDAISEELERLDRDPDAFAKAFHTLVAQSVYASLAADASRLAADPSLDPGGLEAELDLTLDVDLEGDWEPAVGRPREVLDL